MNLEIIQKFFRLALIVVIVGILPPAHSSTIALIGTEELINRSELIFEGTVVSVSAELNEFGRVYTYVDFIIEEVLAGSVGSSSTITLRFTGGIAGGVELDLGVRIPELDEKGIYFVEKVAPGLINPLLGWEQGHFLVNESGEVIAASSLVVESVELRSRPEISSISDGIALGVIAHPRKESDSEDYNNQTNKPMRVSDFKARIKGLRK